MRIHALGRFVLACTATGFLTQTGGAQPGSTATTTAPTKADKTITVSGCVNPYAETANQFTLSDGQGAKYRLSGTDMRRYVGTRVQIVAGRAPKRLRIVGGLVPSPNVAAQADALDPARAAIAANAGTATGNAQPLELRFKRVRRLAGSCP